ncbi:MAG: hypothetical protein Q9222_005093, partial [Ikaeria aurantiellina]
MTRVLLTGGSGFIAIHVLEALLTQGHSVVTSVRSEQKAQMIRDTFPNYSKDKLDFAIVPDIAQEGAFDEAVKSNPPFEWVLHTASPFHFNVTDTKKDLLDPAIIGTTGILKAIKQYAPSVKRVIITSSFAAVFSPKVGNRPGYTYSEKDWNPITEEEAIQDPPSGYRASKTFAEKAAWEFIDKEKPNFTISTMNPPMVFGPIHPKLQTLDTLNTSNQRIRDMMLGKMQDEIPPSGVFVWTDVRDLALAHIRAAERPKAAGKRFFVTAGYYSNRELADDIREKLSDVKIATKGGEFPEGEYFDYDNSRTKDILGIKFRSLKDMVNDTIPTLQAIGAYEPFGPNGDTYNASASYQIPGFYPPGNGTTPPSNWTYNTAILAGSNADYSQTVWIDTPDNTDISSKDLPYLGCITVFFALPAATNKRAQDDDGDCTKTFDQNCAQAMVRFAKQKTIGVSGTNANANDVCASFLSMAVPDACKQYVGGGMRWGNAVASPRIGNSTFSNGTDSRGCSHNDDKSANKGGLTWGFSGPSDDNHTAYDRALTSVTPVLTAAWLKGNNTENLFAQGWSDARFVCMRASQIKEGSQAPKGVPSIG